MDGVAQVFDYLVEGRPQFEGVSRYLMVWGWHFGYG